MIECHSSLIFMNRIANDAHTMPENNSDYKKEMNIGLVLLSKHGLPNIFKWAIFKYMFTDLKT
jgi:hypothetical protein